MFRRTVQRILLVSVLAVAVFAVSAPQADAGWRHWNYAGYYGGYYGGWYDWGWYSWGYHYRPVTYVSYYRPWYGGCYSSCYSPCYSSCYTPCYTTCSSCYCSPCCCATTVVDSCCGSVISSGSVQKVEDQNGGSTAPTPAPSETAPADTAPTVPAPDPLGAPATNPSVLEGVRTQADRGSTILAVTVPEEARVYVNGKLTKTPGTHRRYISRGLVSGFRYTYEVRAELDRAGETLTDTQVVHVRAGETSDLAFDFDRAEPQVAAATTLTLHVPADAQVTLGGNETASSGEVRQFTTTDLPRDEQWKDYRVVVTVQRDGQELRRERTITVNGGDSRELAFNFTENNLAAR